MLKVKQLKPLRIFHFTFDKQYDMCMTFVRLQEFYESPKFKNKRFTFEEYMDWHVVKYGYGVFTYTKYWMGFNVPGNVVNDFVLMHEHSDDDFRPREHDLLFALEGVGVDAGDITEEPYYIIGTMKKARCVLQHEIRHAWFYLVPEYRKDVEKTIKKFKITTLRKAMKQLGYAKSVIVDEIHAYVLTGLHKAMRETKEIALLRNELKAIVKKHGLKEPS